MKLLDLLLAVLFATAALVQYNDPDPLWWMLLYGCVAMLAGTAAFGMYSLPFALLVAGACVVGMALTAPGFYAFLTTPESGSLMQEMSAEQPYVEPAREFLGLLVALAVAAFYAVRARRAPAEAA